MLYAPTFSIVLEILAKFIIRHVFQFRLKRALRRLIGKLIIINDFCNAYLYIDSIEPSFILRKNALVTVIRVDIGKHVERVADFNYGKYGVWVLTSYGKLFIYANNIKDILRHTRDA